MKYNRQLADIVLGDGLSGWATCHKESWQNYPYIIEF